MEQSPVERALGIAFKGVGTSDAETLQEMAALMTKYSWGEGYPVSPLHELEHADYLVGAYEGDTLAGFASVNRVASPDGEGNGQWWLADAVVKPEYRERGIYTKLYEQRMDWLRGKPGQLFTCTEVPLIDDFMLAHGWTKNRDTKDEEGNDCRVYEFQRS